MDAREPPYDAPTALAMSLAELPGTGLRVECSGCTKLTELPTKLLAQQLGAATVLRDVLTRLVCRQCGAGPRAVQLIEWAVSGDGMARRPWRVAVG